MQKLIVAIGLLGSFAGACSNDVGCPRDRMLRGDACLCPTGSVEVGEMCVPSEETPDQNRDPVLGSDDAGVRGPTTTPTPPDDERGDDPVEGSGAPNIPDAPSSAPPSPAADASSEPPPTVQVPRSPIAPTAGDMAPTWPPAASCEVRCASKRCDSAGRCIVEDAVCGNNVREGTEECDDGNNNPYDTCLKCRLPVCGDGYVQPSNNDEECEQGAFSPGWDDPAVTRRTGGVQVWTADTCNFRYCTRRIYNVCSSLSQCPQGNDCIRGMCTPVGCDGWSLEGCPFPACPALPGFEVSTVVNISMSCFVLCRSAEPVCPVGTKCYKGFLGRADVCVGEHESE